MREEKRENKGTDWMEGERCKVRKAIIEDKMQDKMVVWASSARTSNGIVGSLTIRTFNKSTLKTKIASK
jgi:hypothetical protein